MFLCIQRKGAVAPPVASTLKVLCSLGGRCLSRCITALGDCWNACGFSRAVQYKVCATALLQWLRHQHSWGVEASGELQQLVLLCSHS